MEHTKHIWRAGILLFLFLFAAVIARHFMIPESFGREGHYRYASLTEFMAQPLVHGSRTSCAQCHEKEYDAQKEGPHAPVSCAGCHAPLSLHAKGEEKIADMPSNRSYRGCIVCHQKLRARPQSIKQIVPRKHLEDVGVLEPGEKIPDGACLVCHNPHTTKEPE